MPQEDRNETLRWRELAAQAAIEQDSNKLMQIVKELCEEIAQAKHKREKQADGTAA
jgi:hypothetical protein